MRSARLTITAGLATISRWRRTKGSGGAAKPKPKPKPKGGSIAMRGGAINMKGGGGARRPLVLEQQLGARRLDIAVAISELAAVLRVLIDVGETCAEHL